MEVTIDKFGRILIPKKIRQLLGIQPGQTLELIADEETKTIDLIPKEENTAVLKITKAGIPVFNFSSAEKTEFDVAELIRKDREERDRKLRGL